MTAAAVPKRIQRQRTKGWRMPDGAVYVGRPTKWGNPFVVGDLYDRVHATGRYGNRAIAELHVTDRAQAVDLYRGWLEGDTLHLDATEPPNLVGIRGALAGHDLCCWCPLDQPCHADVLLELANGPVSS